MRAWPLLAAAFLVTVSAMPSPLVPVDANTVAELKQKVAEQEQKVAEQEQKVAEQEQLIEHLKSQVRAKSITSRSQHGSQEAVKAAHVKAQSTCTHDPQWDEPDGTTWYTCPKHALCGQDEDSEVLDREGDISKTSS